MRLFIFYLSCFFGFIAGHMVNYSAIMYSLQVFDSSLLAGVAYGLCFGPPIIFGWIAGSYIDRYSAKRVLLIAQNAFILGALGMYLTMLYQPVYSIGYLLISSFFIGIAWSFVAPARLASIGQYVPHEKLPEAMIVLNLLVMLGFGLAPVLLTQILASVGWPGVTLTCIVLFVLSSLLLVNAPNKHKRLVHQNLKQEWQVCFSELKTIPVIPQLLLSAIVGYLMMGPLQVVLPQIADGQLGLSTIQKGQYLGLIAFSLIMGGLLAMALKKHLPIGRSILVMLFFSGLSLALLGGITTLWLSCIVLVFGITLAGIAISFIVAALQAFTPEHIRGRVMSIYTVISQVVSATAGVFAGAIAQGISVPSGLYVVALLLLVLTLCLAFKATHLKLFMKFPA
jgi:MFS family permease